MSKETDRSLDVAVKTVSQLRTVWQETGLLIEDRDSRNIMISAVEDVYQIDLESVYDAVEDSYQSYYSSDESRRSQIQSSGLLFSKDIDFTTL